MHKLTKFHPVLAMCQAGHSQKGVDQGAWTMYQRIFKDYCYREPKVVHTKRFDSGEGYYKLFDMCHSLSGNGPFICIGGDHSVSSPSVLASL